MIRPRHMSCALLLPVLFSLSGAYGAGDNVFAGTQVHTFDIQFSQPAWWDSLTIYYDAGEEQYLAAMVVIDGVPLDSVGVRLKGNASYTHPNDKKPFRLKFDEFREDLRWDDLKGIHLNNCWEDPTFMREKLHLDFCRDAGIPAPRGNFAELSLNGELWGFYSLVEHVDGLFVDSRFGNSGSNRYKAVDGLLNPLKSDFKWYGSDTSAYVIRYELKTEGSADAWTDLIAVIDSLNNTPDVATALPPAVNLRGLYRAIGTDLLMASLDSYAGSCRNFYCYFNSETGKMEWIVWDAGMSFGSYWGEAQNYETLSITYVSDPVDRPLLGRIFASPTLLEEYLHAFCGVYAYHFSMARLLSQIDNLTTLIRPYVYADPRKMYTNEQFEENIDHEIIVGGHRKPGLRSFITARDANVAEQLQALGITCEGIAPGDVVINEFAADNTQILDPAGEADDWIEFYNNTEHSISLDGMFLTDDELMPTQWEFPPGTTIEGYGFLIVWADEDLEQEGLHANFKLSAGGEYIRFSDVSVAVLDSVSFGPQTTDMTMARVPNGTGPFVEGFPTFNGPNGIAPGDVVINEFAADNTEILDPAGEAEDWIELYNNTNHSISLDGMFLTNDEQLPALWEFPVGTTIEGYGFLIVWADEDLGQEGLHADFRLPLEGGYLRLSSVEMAVLDSVSYGPQTANLTMARIPNGTGPFVQGEPTFNGHNGYGNLVGYGEVVINEYMADNDTVVFDPSGEADDWLELYNNTDREIDLGGLYLSDDFAEPTKWQIPVGTVIATDGYLLIWADEDLDQEGLHADFKLSADGEEILLSNVDLSVVDSTSFGPQLTDVSMARIPNGTGPFEQCWAPTPGANNEGGSATGEPILSADAMLAGNLPNPFTVSTTITFSIARRGPVELQVLDLQGRRVAALLQEELPPGVYRVPFVGSTLPSGVYLCRLRTADRTAVGRMLLVK